MLTELEGSRIDEAAFARMAPEDVALVAECSTRASDEPEDEFDLESAESRAEMRDDLEAERTRLEEVIADSRSRQQALERYLEALDGEDGTPDAARSLPD